MKPWLIEHQQRLSKQFELQILPHAILITGVQGAGKLQLAQWLMQLLACQRPSKTQTQDGTEILQACGQCKTCLLARSDTLPDHLNLKAEKNSIGVDEIRFANSFLQKTAQLGHYKTVLIEHSEIMTVAAANALLKTLEEPTDNSIIVLLTDDIEQLLPTIVSRTRVLSVRPVVGEALLRLLGDGAIELSQEKFVNLTQLPELTDKAVYEDFLLFKQIYLNFIYNQQDESLFLQHVLNNQHSLRWLEQITVGLQREQLLSSTEPARVKTQDKLTAQALHQLYKVIINGCKVIKSYTQANKQFVSEQLIMKISDVVEQTQINKQES
ncbi:MAG: DNA polymerase III subunit delta' [Colwellia sp.]|nr:DNA polymerase III subunit delta' [Colwellia sp.]MCW8864488.1 DNA polymerase III subunit delta' [Colwellia sp.]MCW9081064.1 DNA polymerase III subunit delta' [Colwellia sp.]